MKTEDKKEFLRRFLAERGHDKCQRCNHKLRNPNSMLRGYGPVCWEKVNPSPEVLPLPFKEKLTKKIKKIS